MKEVNLEDVHQLAAGTSHCNQMIRDRDWNELESNLFSNLVHGMVDNPQDFVAKGEEAQNFWVKLSL